MLGIPLRMFPMCLFLLIANVFCQNQTNQCDFNGSSCSSTNASPQLSLEILFSPEFYQRIEGVKEQIAQYPNALENINNLNIDGMSSKLLDLFTSIQPSQEAKTEILATLEEYPQILVPHGMEFFVEMIKMKNMEEKLKVMVFLEDSDYLQIRMDFGYAEFSSDYIPTVAQSSELRNLLQLHKILLNLPSNSTWFEIMSEPPLPRAQLMLLSRVIRHEFPEMSIELYKLSTDLKLGSFNASAIIQRIDNFLEKGKDVEEAFSRMNQEEQEGNINITVQRLVFEEELNNFKEHREKSVSIMDGLRDLMTKLGVPSAYSVEDNEDLHKATFEKLGLYIERIASGIFKMH